MKQLIYLAIAVLAFAIGACSSSKHSPAKLDGGKLLEKTYGQILAEEKPGVRAYGESSNGSLSLAKSYATGFAEAEFTNGLRSSITSAIRNEHYSYRKSKVNDKKTTRAGDEELSQHLMNQTLAYIGDVRGLVPIYSDTYKQKNGDYRAYVCVEFRGDIQQLANQITDAYKDALEEEEYGEDNVSQDKRDEIDKRTEEFRNSIKEELERLMHQN